MKLKIMELNGLNGNKIAEQLYITFKEKSILLKDYTNNIIMFIDREWL